MSQKRDHAKRCSFVLAVSERSLRSSKINGWSWAYGQYCVSLDAGSNKNIKNIEILLKRNWNFPKHICNKNIVRILNWNNLNILSISFFKIWTSYKKEILKEYWIIGPNNSIFLQYFYLILHPVFWTLIHHIGWLSLMIWNSEHFCSYIFSWYKQVRATRKQYVKYSRGKLKSGRGGRRPFPDLNLEIKHSRISLLDPLPFGIAARESGNMSGTCCKR